MADYLQLVRGEEGTEPTTQVVSFPDDPSYRVSFPRNIGGGPLFQDVQTGGTLLTPTGFPANVTGFAPRLQQASQTTGATGGGFLGGAAFGGGFGAFPLGRINFGGGRGSSGDGGAPMMGGMPPMPQQQGPPPFASPTAVAGGQMPIPGMNAPPGLAGILGAGNPDNTNAYLMYLRQLGASPNPGMGRPSIGGPQGYQ